ncbi:unnamed protein product [Amoebophrya sp. A120]|nr:unnamed protein product [Amoebophrya sp. A120]|eukprot:GSA120T00000155001.1
MSGTSNGATSMDSTTSLAAAAPPFGLRPPSFLQPVKLGGVLASQNQPLNLGTRAQQQPSQQVGVASAGGASFLVPSVAAGTTGRVNTNYPLLLPGTKYGSLYLASATAGGAATTTLGDQHLPAQPAGHQVEHDPSGGGKAATGTDTAKNAIPPSQQAGSLMFPGAPREEDTNGSTTGTPMEVPKSHYGTTPLIMSSALVQPVVKKYQPVSCTIPAPRPATIPRPADANLARLSRGLQEPLSSMNGSGTSVYQHRAPHWFVAPKNKPIGAATCSSLAARVGGDSTCKISGSTACVQPAAQKDKLVVPHTGSTAAVAQLDPPGGGQGRAGGSSGEQAGGDGTAIISGTKVDCSSAEGVEDARVVYQQKSTCDKLMAMTTRFDGSDFFVAGRPLLLDCKPPTDAGETGLRVWDAGIVLAKYLETHFSRSGGATSDGGADRVLFLPEGNITDDRDHDQGGGSNSTTICSTGRRQATACSRTTTPLRPRKKVLELGAGTGISGLAAALCGHDVTVTDKAGTVGAQLRANLARNERGVRDAGGSCQYRELDWDVWKKKQYGPATSTEDQTSSGVAPAPVVPEHVREFTRAGVDVILASDVVWAHPFIASFLQVLQTLCTHLPTSVQILFAHKQRDSTVEDAFLRALPEYGFRVVEKLLSGGLPPDHVFYSGKVQLYRLSFEGSWYYHRET